MKTYFCRHSSELDIDSDTFNFLWNNNYMGVHYPHTKDGITDFDSRSIIPEDYKTSGKKALNALWDISKNGGYIFAVYENINECKIGFVSPLTEIELIEGKWGNKNEIGDRVAVLKCLKFTSCITLSAIEVISLTCAQPRQGTLCIWHGAGMRVENLFKGTIVNKTISDLTPDLQEVLCSEYLRHHTDRRLPRLISLLTPVGRTMKDVDIVGLADDGMKILAQVTYSYEPTFKIEKLLKYNFGNEILILFCKTENPRIERNIIIYSIDEVFNKFTKSEIGIIWTKNII